MSDRCLPQHQNHRRRPLRQRGSVLLLAMWFLLLLSGIAIGIAAMVRSDVHLAFNIQEETQVRETAQAAIRRVVLDLIAPDSPDKLAVGKRSFEVLGTRVAVEVVDECAKVDLNTGWALLLRGLVGGIETTDGTIDLGQAMLDWRDPDNRRRSKGAEDEAYAGARRDYRPHNGSFETIEELQLVLGMTPLLYRELSPLVTVDCLNAGVDPLLASRAVLARVPGLDPAALAAFLDFRERASPAEAEEQAESLEKDQRYLEASLAMAYTVTATAERPSGARVTWRAVVWITGDPTSPYLFRTWQEMMRGSDK